MNLMRAGLTTPVIPGTVSTAGTERPAPPAPWPMSSPRTSSSGSEVCVIGLALIHRTWSPMKRLQVMIK